MILVTFSGWDVQDERIFANFAIVTRFLKEESLKFFKTTRNYHNSLNHENEKARSSHSATGGVSIGGFGNSRAGCDRPLVVLLFS